MNSKQILAAVALVATACMQLAMAVTSHGLDNSKWVPLESEAGMFIFGGGSESGGIGQLGGSSESGGIGQLGGSSESGGISQSGAESESGGMAETGTESESGGLSETGASSETNYDPQYGIKYYNW